MSALSILARIVSLAALLALASCQGVLELDERENAPIPKYLLTKMKAKGMAPGDPIMLRIFKQDDVLEVWKRRKGGRYALLEKYDICKWSGKFGPKFKEGDRQAPEGFYNVTPAQMNPRSSYHLSFNMGFPNAYDRAHGRTGSHLMVHGACSSAGCYSMNDEPVQEIYALAREAFAGGQKAFQIQAYPFRMTPKNMAAHRDREHYPFWQMLKEGYDHFALTGRPPKVDVCNKRYVFNTRSEGTYRPSAECPEMTMPPALATSFVKRQEDYFDKFAKRLKKSERAALAPVTFATALPGISVAGQTPEVVKEVVVEPAASDEAKPAANPLADG